MQPKFMFPDLVEYLLYLRKIAYLCTIRQSRWQVTVRIVCFYVFVVNTRISAVCFYNT
jgi:hypothetical protein